MVLKNQGGSPSQGRFVQMTRCDPYGFCLRDLKTTLGMEELRCKSHEMAEKELLAYLVAHNLVRCLMAEAVAWHRVDSERVSSVNDNVIFLGTVGGRFENPCPCRFGRADASGALYFPSPIVRQCMPL
jgi:hypothetical protein